jgi:hypothetical protein
MYIFRVVLFLLRWRRGAGLGELQLARGRSKYFAISLEAFNLFIHESYNTKRVKHDL